MCEGIRHYIKKNFTFAPRFAKLYKIKILGVLYFMKKFNVAVVGATGMVVFE